MATIRCPDCQRAMLNTPRIVVQRAKRESETLPFKVCRICKIIILDDSKRIVPWRLWNGEYHQLVDIR